MTNKWIEHVKQKSQELGITYRNALSDPRVKSSYTSANKIDATPVKKQRKKTVPTTENIHNYLKYKKSYFRKWYSNSEINEWWNEDTLVFGYDYEDDAVEEIMQEDIRPELGKRLNLMWVEKIKEKAKWKEGETLYVNYDEKYGTVWCEYTKDNSIREVYNELHNKTVQIKPWKNLIIDSLGYASMAYYNNYTDKENEDVKFQFFIRSDSVYNDMISLRLKSL